MFILDIERYVYGCMVHFLNENGEVTYKYSHYTTDATFYRTHTGELVSSEFLAGRE